MKFFLKQSVKAKICLVTLLIIANCGGGGGGGGGSSSSSNNTTTNYGNPNWDSSISSSEANVYRTSEYDPQYTVGSTTYQSYNLEQINAAEAYGLLAKNGKTVAGDGIKIGIIDSGVQTNHVEIAANYSSSGSYDYVNNDSNPTDDNGHGTNVASIAAGVKDGSGMHGVAYDATIIAEKVLDSSGNGTYQNVADGINGAVSAGAKIINLSLGGTSASSTLRNALISAKSADVLTVAATGNSGASQPEYPAYYAADSSLLGYVLAVGAVDSSSTIASFSNQCGDAKNYCLVAPGVEIFGAYTGSAYAQADGTSQATPHVAGAAAVIRGAWPFLSAAQTSQILLKSATDLGVAGVDSVYGYGLLNLEAAVQAQGQNTLGYGTSVADGGYEVTTSSIVTSPIFGDAFSANIAPQLSSAIFFDDYGRDYSANLDSKISSNNSNNLTNLNNFIFNNITSKTLPFSFGEDQKNNLKLTFSDYKDAQATNYFGLKYLTLDRSQDPQSNLSRGFSFAHNAGSFSPNLKLGLSFNIDEVTNLQGEEFFNPGFISQKNFAAGPYQSFMQGSSLNLQNSRQFNQLFANQMLPNKKLALNFSYQSSYDSTQLLSKINNKQNQVLDLGLSFKPKKGQSFLVSTGNLTEFSNNILNSKSLGAFESQGDVKTYYVKVSSSYNLAKNLDFLTSLSEGFSKINGNQFGIFREFDNVRSRSSSIALIHHDFFKGKIGIAYAEPLRVYSGKVKIDVPVARDYEGNLTRYQTSASLAPKGHQRDLEIFYSRSLGDFSQVKFNFVAQSQPGNVKTAQNNYLGFVQFLMSR